MPKVEVVVTIDRPPEEVFAFLADMEHLPRWDRQYLRVKNTSPSYPVRAGTTYRFRRQGPKGPIESTLEITEFEPHRRLSWQTAPDRVQSVCTYLLEPANGGTRLTALLETRLSGLLRVLSPLFLREIRLGAGIVYTQLKEVLESPPPDSPGQR